MSRFAAGWREVVDSARDLGLDVPAGRTRREEAVALSTLPVGHLAAAADTAVFGPGDPAPQAAEDYWSAVTQACQQMTRAAGRWGRLRAALSIRSLRRPRPAPGAAT